MGEYIWLVYIGIFFVSLIAAGLYWVGRYYFSTDQEEASRVLTEKPSSSPSDKDNTKPL